jgi:SpoIID/LytB domain protein
VIRRRLAVVTAAAVLGVLAPAVRLPVATAFPGASVHLEGAGWGHGRGMGQYGALGYALDGSSYRNILNHFYGGTKAGSIGNPTITVRLLTWDDRDTLAFSPAGLSVTGVGGAPTAVLVIRKSGAKFAIYTATGCGGPWNLATTRAGPIDVNPRPGGMVGLCEAVGLRVYRGGMRVLDSGAGQRVVNHVALNSYLRGVVPRESPASWGGLGGGKGMEALKAQAVAARSYAWAENRYRTTGDELYAKTCDTTACQVYGGYSLNGTVIESANTNAAVDATSGEIRVFSGGAPARAEFSSSTGGWTTGGTFSAVRDDGDAVSNNPNHRWTASVSVAAIQAAYPAIGTLRAVDITKRNGLGEWGGRVQSLVLRGTKGSATLTGDQFRSRFGLKSDWFRVVNNPSGGVAGYHVLDVAGGVFTMGNARYYGSVPGLIAAGASIGRAGFVSIAATPSGRGYWVLDKAGGIFTFGDARFYGSVPGLRAGGVSIGAADIIGIATTPTGRGYWILDSAGGMFAFGDARFRGSVPGLRAAGTPVGPARIIGMTPTPTGSGYWILDSSGGIFAFGDARFFGSIPQLRNKGVRIGPMTLVDIATTPTGRGYWILDSAGGIFTFGDARYYGSLPAARIAGLAVAMMPTFTGRGYLILTAAEAAVHPFGDAPDFGGVLDATGVNTTGLDLTVVAR